MYRDILIDCNVVPALLSRIRPDTPVRFHRDRVARPTQVFAVHSYFEIKNKEDRCIDVEGGVNIDSLFGKIVESGS